jgi:anti-anti-sigma factor
MSDGRRDSHDPSLPRDDMKIEQQQVGTVDVFTPIGPLVDQDGDTFTRALSQRLKSANPRVVVAMHDVPYVDSAALEGLLAAAEELYDRASALKLAAVTPTCREIFELTGLAPRLRFFKDVQDAVKSFL